MRKKELWAEHDAAGPGVKVEPTGHCLEDLHSSLAHRMTFHRPFPRFVTKTSI